MLSFALILTACGGGGGSSNTAPVSSDQTVSIDEDIATAITLDASDDDADNLTYTISDPANGTISGTAPDITYTPDANFNGDDSFTFNVHDGGQRYLPRWQRRGAGGILDRPATHDP